ncbi:lipoprotein [Bacillus sp. es.036]
MKRIVLLLTSLCMVTGCSHVALIFEILTVTLPY